MNTSSALLQASVLGHAVLTEYSKQSVRADQTQHTLSTRSIHPRACALLAPYVLQAHQPCAMALALKLKRMAQKMLLPPPVLATASLPAAQGLVLPLHPFPHQHLRSSSSSLHHHGTNSTTTTASLSAAAAAANAASSCSDWVLPRHPAQPVGVMLGTATTNKEGVVCKASSNNRMPMHRRKVRTL
eukprot:1138666-Pelagomonas_calceolata.AAC.7